MTAFLLARILEKLDAESCDYIIADGRVICYCETLSEPVEQALNDLDLIRFAAEVFGPDNPIAALLADEYATHPEYEPEWHFFLGRR